MKRKLLLVMLLFAVLSFLTISMTGCAADKSGQGALSEERGPYPNATYRGTFHDGGFQQVGVQFFLEDGQLYDLTFRVLSYSGNDFLNPDDPDNEWSKTDVENLSQQYHQLLGWLEGKDISEIGVFVESPEVAADDVEGSGDVSGIDLWTSATMRGTKITNAIRDGLNRGPY